MTPMTFEEIDLSKTNRKGGAGLEVGPLYLVLYRGQHHLGRFNEQWYGLNFCGIYDAGAQYDPPGTNASSWQRIWRVDVLLDPASLEDEYKIGRREHAAKSGCTLLGVPITRETPLEAFGYVPDYSNCPRAADDEEEEEW